MVTLPTLRFLGGASLEGSDGPIVGRATQRHRLALLALLTLEARGMSRDKLVAFLWPERSDAKGRHALSDSIYRINKALGDNAIISVGDQGVRLNHDTIPSDVAAFREALAGGDWKRAVAVYGGPFLDGFHLSRSIEFDRWADVQRQRLARSYAEALESLADERSTGGDLGGAVAAWRRRAALEPYDSRVALRLMRALEAQGNPAGALGHAQAHAELLQRDLDAEPDPQVAAAAAQIRKGHRRALGPELPSGAPEPRAGITGNKESPRAETDRAAALPDRPPARPVRSQRPLRSRAGASRRSSYALLSITVLALVAAGAWIALLAATGETSGLAIPAEPTAHFRPYIEAEGPWIAVLAFEDLSPEGDRAWLADGTAEEIAFALARIEHLHVIAPQSSFAFGDGPEDVRAIADTLGARFLVDGSVRGGGDSIWVSAQLIDGETGLHRWGRTYATASSSEGLRSIQNGIARRVATSLSLRIRSGSFTPSELPDDSDYEAYLEGRFLLRRFQSGASANPADILRSLDIFERVVEESPGWADGWASLGEAHHWAAFRGFEPEKHRVESKRALETALALNPEHAQANASLGYVLHRLDRDYEGAEEYFRRALGLDSGQYWHCGYALFLLWAGRYEDAVDATRRAEGHEPLYWPLTSLRATSYRCVGRFEDAIEQAQRVLSRQPSAGGARRDLALALERSGRPDVALQTLEEAPEGGEYLSLVRALVLARGGRTEEAETTLARVDVDEAVEWTSGYSSQRLKPAPVHAAALVALGRPEEAVRVLEAAVERDPTTLLYDRCYPELGRLEDDARYRELLRETGVPGW
jgi:DNA-binding SARP family transcriptional activator/TolB-like protein/Tfp pilus assembly protein PilF